MRLLTVAAALAAGVLLALSVSGTEALAGDGAAVRPKMQGAASRIAVKLAPGARLADTADGSLTVIRDWPSLKAPGRPGGVPLEAVGQIESLGVSILEPAVSSASASELEVDLEAAAKELRLRPGVLWAEVSSPVYACLVPNDPYYPATGGSVGQWGSERVGLPAAWDISVGSRNVVIAVLDTGINPDIADFSGRIVSPYSVLTNSSQWPAWKDGSETGHGSAVAGIAAAQGNNGAGIAGAAWNVKIMPVKISDNGESDTLLLAEAIDYAAAQGADVINVSFATPPGSTAGLTLKSAVASAVAKGAVIVAAAGNWGATSVGYPAGLPGVIGVGATDSFDALWTQAGEASNTGSALDIAAPGGRILSYYKASDERFGCYGGTSMASPLVAGVAALMLSVDPSLAAEEVTDILAGCADDLGAKGWDEQFGWGLLDADEAVSEVRDGTSPSSTTTTSSTTSTTTTVPSSTSTTTTTALSTTTTLIAAPRFVDVTEDSTPYWYEIGYLASMGVVTGFSDGLFRPEDEIKRQQFAKMITLAAGCTVTEDDTCPFVDVQRFPGDLYPYHYVAVAYQCGFTQGTTAAHFSPYRMLTRAQLITMVARAAGLPEPPAAYTPPFGDFSVAHYPFARKAAYAGLLDGLAEMGPDYGFLAPATRAEVCLLLYGLLTR
ncbi:MAG: S8 family serine peptidase [Thermoleophilia bacterium]|nr:S8 family serine peptidase [Thermoleophilia bacterium]